MTKTTSVAPVLSQPLSTTFDSFQIPRRRNLHDRNCHRDSRLPPQRLGGIERHHRRSRGKHPLRVPCTRPRFDKRGRAPHPCKLRFILHGRAQARPYGVMRTLSAPQYLGGRSESMKGQMKSIYSIAPRKSPCAIFTKRQFADPVIFLEPYFMKNLTTTKTKVPKRSIAPTAPAPTENTPPL